MHGAARYRERRAAQRGDAAEALDDAPHVERKRRAGGVRRRGGGCRGRRERGLHRRASPAAAGVCPSAGRATPASSFVTSTDGTNVYAGSDRSPAR